MSSSEFVSLCRDFTSLSDCVKIEVKEEKYTLKNNNAERIEDQVTIVNKEDVTCSYGLQYLNSFAKASSLSNIVTLHISAKYPLMIDYEIEDLGYLKFYLAPKMDDDEASNDAEK